MKIIHKVEEKGTIPYIRILLSIVLILFIPYGYSAIDSSMPIQTIYFIGIAIGLEVGLGLWASWIYYLEEKKNKKQIIIHEVVK